ncbi:MAG TPA: hypothetical protein VIU11_00285 [Nakamurella sp.]
MGDDLGSLFGGGGALAPLEQLSRVEIDDGIGDLGCGRGGSTADRGRAEPGKAEHDHGEHGGAYHDEPAKAPVKRMVCGHSYLLVDGPAKGSQDDS